MDQWEEDIWDQTAKLRIPGSESIAVRRCRKGESFPLMVVLKQYGLPNELIILICLTIKNRSKLTMFTKRFFVGYELEKRLRQRPGQKKVIQAELADQYQRRGEKLTPKTAENYHRHYLNSLKKRGWTRADLDEFRTRYSDPTFPT